MRFWNILELSLLGHLATTAALPAANNKGTFKALYDFTSQATGEATLHKGDLVNVLQEDASGWWLVQRLDGSTEGWTPGSYLSKVGSSPLSSTKARSRASKPSPTSARLSRTTSSQDIEHTSTLRSSSSPGRLSTSTRQSSKFPLSASSTRWPSTSSTKTIPSTLPMSSSHSSSSASSSINAGSFDHNASTSTSVLETAISSSILISLLSTSLTTTPSLTSKTPHGTSTLLSAALSTGPRVTSSTNGTKAVSYSTAESTNSLRSTPTSPTSTNSLSSLASGITTAKSSLASVTGQAISGNSSTAAVPPECADPGGVNGVTTACWNALNMSEYVNQWMLSHQGVCSAHTSFAQCFLQVLDIGMNDCVSISSGTCPPPSWLQFKDHAMSVRDFYAAYNIYAVWTFFNSYYAAIGNARSAATDSVAAIVALLDPPKANNAELSNLNFALAIGLTFVKIEGFAAPALESLIGLVVNAAKQAPQIARYLFPGPPGDTKFTQLGQISNQMGTLTDNLQKNVAIALSAIQNDTSTFLSFTGTGAFSNNPVVKLDQQSNNLLTALNTYVISLCLQANNWQISRAMDTDINQLMANGTHLTWNITGCGTGYDSDSTCGGYYWNKTADVSYTLTNTDDMFSNPQPIMQQFFANWTTPELLFDGALQCQMAKGTGNPDISPVAGATDMTSTPCLSSVKICTWDLNPSHFGTQYEYTDCDVQTQFATQGCTQCDATTDFCTNVPSTYMGGYLLNQLADGPQYVYCNNGQTTIDAN